MASLKRSRRNAVEEEEEPEVVETPPVARKSARRNAAGSATPAEPDERTESSGAATGRAQPSGRDNRATKFTDGEGEEDPDYAMVVRQYKQHLGIYAEKPIATELSKEEVNRLVSMVMRHILFKRAETGPTSREELATLVSQTHKGKRDLLNYVIAIAQAKFPSNFGMEMKEIEKHKRSKLDAKKKAPEADNVPAQRMYVLRSLLPCRMRRKFVETPTGSAHHSFTMMVLSIMVAQGENDTVEEEKLWEYLGSMGVVRGTKHPTFGDPDVLLQQLVKQRYLHKDKAKTLEGDAFMYSMGEVAQDQIPTSKIKAFIATVMTEDGQEDDEDVVELD